MGLFDVGGAQTALRLTSNGEMMAAAALEAQSSCFHLLNGVIQSVLSGPDHKPLD